MTIYAVRGVFLPDERERTAWIVGGRLSFTRPSSSEVETVVDGGWILPGFVDAHCHIGYSPNGFLNEPDAMAAQAETDRAVGTLLLRDAGSPVDNTSVQTREDLPRLVRAGRHIARPKRYIRYLGVEVEPDQLVAEVERQAARSDGWVKLAADWIDRSKGAASDLEPVWPDDILAAAISRAHELGARVAAHVFGEDAIAPLLAAGLDSLEHGTGLTDETIAQAVDVGTVVVPTLVNIDTFPQIAQAADGKYDVYAAHMRSLHATSRERIRAAWEAGVPVFTGTDAGGTLPHGLVPQEVRALVAAGIPQAEVIALATWKAREWLGFDSLVESGPADLVAYDADPRTELDTIDAPRRIMLRGHIVY